MNKKLIYITYQTFPSFTANSIQTITHLSHFSKKNNDVTLIFPLRNKDSDDSINVLQEFYGFEENFRIIGTIHPLPFKKINFYEKGIYIFSHFLWSFFTVKKYYKNQENSKFFTRSEWVFYFLSKKGLNVIYECHQISKIKKILINKCKDNKNSKIIFMNPYMLEELSISESNKIKVLPSAYDETIFKKYEKTPDPKRIIYAGSLLRFGETRGIDLFIKSLVKINDQSIQLVIATTNNDSITYIKKIKESYENINLEIHTNLSRKEIAELYKTCSIGILINNDSIHATKFTSPLKFFEYIASNLKILANQNPAHNLLPYQDNFYYFDENRAESIEEAISNVLAAPEPQYQNILTHSMNDRVKKIIDLFE